MKVLLATAHKLEIPLKRYLPKGIIVKSFGLGAIDFAIAFQKFLTQNKIDRVILFGLAGAQKNSFSLTQVLIIKNNFNADETVWQKNEFTSFESLGLKMYKKENNKLNHGIQLAKKLKYPIADAISVQMLSDNKKFNQLRLAKYNAKIECMEGAAFQKICKEYKIPFVELRAISNFIGERNKEKWQVQNAIE